MFRENAAAAANWTLLAFAVQFAAAVCADAAGLAAGMALLAVFWLMSVYAALRLRCRVSLAAACAGAALALLRLGGLTLGGPGEIASNLVFLLYYLPLQNAFDRKMAGADVSNGTRRMGRVWAWATLVQRSASMLGFLPYFEGQDALSTQQGHNTALFTLQLALEVIALLAALVSYIWMVRYLWRARVLLKGEETLV